MSCEKVRSRGGGEEGGGEKGRRGGQEEGRRGGGEEGRSNGGEEGRRGGGEEGDEEVQCSNIRESVDSL